MKKSISFSFLFILITVMITGCSSSTKTNPVSPQDIQSDLSQPLLESDISNSSHSILGTYL